MPEAVLAPRHYPDKVVSGRISIYFGNPSVPFKHSIAAALAALAIATAFSSPSAASPVPDFTCNVQPHPLLQANGYLLGSNIYMMGDRVGLVGYADLPEQLPQVVSGSGMQFSNGQITFSAKGDNGLLELVDGTRFPCSRYVEQVTQPVSPSAGGLNELALALDTIVRNAPNAAAGRIEKLPLNEPVMLVRETGAYYQDFQWYEIEYSEGQRGFAWGGTLCADTELSGILIDCRRFAGVTARQRLTGAAPTTPQQPAAPSGGGQIFGQSLFGSKIRSQPDPNARQVASIAQGTAIEIVQETGAFFDGWQWVLIRYGNGNQGYVWGGTICVTQGRAPSGVHASCN